MNPRRTLDSGRHALNSRRVASSCDGQRPHCLRQQHYHRLTIVGQGGGIHVAKPAATVYDLTAPRNSYNSYNVPGHPHLLLTDPKSAFGPTYHIAITITRRAN